MSRPQITDADSFTAAFVDEFGESAEPLGRYIGERLDHRSAFPARGEPAERMGRRRRWCVLAALAAAMLAVPPWASSFRGNTTAQGYGFIFTGPFSEDADDSTIHLTRLLVQFTLLGAVGATMELWSWSNEERTR